MNPTCSQCSAPMPPLPEQPVNMFTGIEWEPQTELRFGTAKKGKA